MIVFVDPEASAAANSDQSSTFTGEWPLVRQPHNKFLRRLPVVLYRLGFGPFLGIMPFLVLTTRGGSDLVRYTPLEYRRHGSRIYVLATRSDAKWLQRVTEDGVVTVRIGVQDFPAAATVVSDEAEAVRALFQFRMDAPIPLRWIYWSGRNRNIVHPQNFKDAARRYTFVRLEKLEGRAKAIEGVPADRAWMTWLFVAAVALTLYLTRQRQ